MTIDDEPDAKSPRGVTALEDGGGSDRGLTAVIFDWGGTLAQFATIDLEDLWRLAARHLAPGRESEVATQLAAIEESFWERSSRDHRAWTLAELLATARSSIGVDVAEALLEEAGVLYLDAWTPHIRHEPDAVEVLQALRARGLRLGLLSNTHWPRAFHEHFLERDGLNELLDARLYTSEMQHTKPHIEAFRSALAALDVHDPGQAAFVGDRPYDDISGARAAGMRAVLRRNNAVPSHDVDPDATIDRLSDLLVHIDAWL
ncbi:MAG: HAD family hydrolase [Dehalococcoidia bacterium]